MNENPGFCLWRL